MQRFTNGRCSILNSTNAYSMTGPFPCHQRRALVTTAPSARVCWYRQAMASYEWHDQRPGSVPNRSRCGRKIRFLVA